MRLSIDRGCIGKNKIILYIYIYRARAFFVPFLLIVKIVTQYFFNDFRDTFMVQTTSKLYKYQALH